MAKQKEIKFQLKHGDLVGRQNGVIYRIFCDHTLAGTGEPNHTVMVCDTKEPEKGISTAGHISFHLNDAKEFCQQIAGGKITLEELQSRFDAEDDAKERAAFREITEKAKKFHARLDAMGLKYTDLLELEVLAHALGDMGHNILLGYERGRAGQMGPENSGGQFVAYIDGRPVEIGKTLAEITPDYSAGGVSAEEATTALATASTAWANLSMTIEVAADAIRGFIDAMDLATAVWLARIFEPAMAHRYLHTKKKRTRKKYEKRIRAWFWEVFR